MRTAPPINVFKQSLFASVLIKFYLQPAWSKVFIETPSCHLRGHKFHHNFSACLDEICICGKDIESTNHFLLQSSLFLKVRQVLIKFVILTAHLLTKMKTLSVIHFFLVKKTWMTVITPIFFMQQLSTSYQLKSSAFRISLTNLSLQLITTAIINDLILFELTSSFCFFLFLFFRRFFPKRFYIWRLFLCVPFFIDFISIFYAFMKLFKLYMCICMSRIYIYIYFIYSKKIQVKNCITFGATKLFT